MKRIIVDKIGSVTRNCKLSRELFLGADIPAVEGGVVVVRVLTDKSTYNQLELPSGRLSRVKSGATARLPRVVSRMRTSAFTSSNRAPLRMVWLPKETSPVKNRVSRLPRTMMPADPRQWPASRNSRVGEVGPAQVL